MINILTTEFDFEIANLEPNLKPTLSLNCQSDYPKIQELILPDFIKCKFLHAGFYVTPFRSSR